MKKEENKMNKFLLQKSVLNNKKHASGITLIALVITIIVLLILAGVAISTLTGENGLLEKSQNAKSTAIDAEIEEQIKLAYQDYYLSKYTETGYTLQDALSKTGLTIVSVEGNDITGYEVKVNTNNGKKVYTLQSDGSVGVASNEWTYDGRGTYSRGIKQIKVGKKVNYNEGTANQYEFSTDTSKGIGASGAWNSNYSEYTLTSGTYKNEDLSWRVLGVNSQGQVELISETPHSVSIYLSGEEAYLNGTDELDKMCNALYGKGSGACRARCLKVTDLNILANYNPEEDETDNEMYGSYRKYRFKSDGSYERSDSADGQSNWSEWSSMPTYYGITSFRIPGSNTTISSNNPGESTPVRDTKFSYNAKNKIKNAISVDFANLIFNNYGTRVLSSSCSYYGDGCQDWGLFLFYDDDDPYDGTLLSAYKLYSSSGWASAWDGKIQPVVVLDSDTQLSWDSASDEYVLQQ